MVICMLEGSGGEMVARSLQVGDREGMHVFKCVRRWSRLRDQVKRLCETVWDFVSGL